MKTYNRALDYVTLAMATARKGDVTTAAKLFAKAISAHDSTRAIAILEASNKQAFAATAAAAKAKANPTSAAAKRIKADAEFDMGEDTDIDNLVGDEGDEPEMEEAVVEDDEDEDDFDEQFASVLANMNKKAKR